MTGDDRASADRGRRAIVYRRWLRSINRVTGEPDYPDEWYWQQCADCRHWLPLAGQWGQDWGVCANPAAEFDGRVRFEHDGCNAFEGKAI